MSEKWFYFLLVVFVLLVANSIIGYWDERG